MPFNEMRKVKIKDIAFVTKLAGFEYTKHLSGNFKNSGVPVVQGRNITSGTLNFDKMKYIDSDLSDALTRSQVNKDTILLSYVGTVGEVYHHKSSVRLHLGSNVAKIEPNITLVDPEFLYYTLKSPLFKQGLSERTKGSVQKNINMKDIRSIEVGITNKKNQKTIANILSSLDDKIEINKKINMNLEEIAMTLYKRWFVDFEFPNEDGEPYKSSGGEMIESELGLIPAGWQVVNFSDLMSIKSGVRPPTKTKLIVNNNTIPVIGASGIMAYTTEYNLSEKCLVMGRVGTHGIIQRIFERVWASDNTLIIYSNLFEYTYQLLMSIDYSALNRGSTQPLITQTDIKNVRIVKGELKVHQDFENVITPLFNKHKNCLEESKRLTEVRNLILPKLMSGEIEV